MEPLNVLAIFFNKAAQDARISINHIGLYAALLQMTLEQGFDKPLITFSYAVMKVSKISSTATYYRLMRELNAYGYIEYRPSFYKGLGSKIILKE